MASGSTSDVSIVEPPSLMSLHIVDHSTEAPREYESCMQSGGRRIPDGSGSLFTIEPADPCSCSNEKHSSEQEKQNDETFMMEEKIENANEDGGLIVSSSPVSIQVLDHSTESLREHDTCMQSRDHSFSIGGHSLFIIEPAEGCLCSKQKLSFKREKQKVSIIDKQEEMETTKENFDTTGIGSVGVCSADGSLAPPDVESLQSKLLATMQILENKEETIRVQARSLALAEARIAELTSRSKPTCPQSPKSSRGTDPCLREKIDFSTNINFQQDGRRHDKIVATLQDNLSVIEKLYKECFYETAKQDELINSLRDSFAEVRLMEKEKTDQIGRIQNALNAQKWSLDRRQDIAMEVESLKSDISNYLHNSNYDSNDCICGLNEENVELRQSNKNLAAQNAELRQRVQLLESTNQNKCRENMQCQQQLELREEEFRCMSQRLAAVEQSSNEQTTVCDSLTQQLQQLQILLTEKSAQLLHMRQQCDLRQNTMAELHRQLNEAQGIIEREREDCEEARKAARGASEWRRRCRERTASMSRLRTQLLEAQSRGARLCADTQALLAALRSCLCRYKQRIREQQERIKEQDELIRNLSRGANQKSASTCYDEPSCSRYIQQEESRRGDRVSCTKCAFGRRPINASGRGITGCSKCKSRVEERDGETSGSEITSRSSPPKPPRRLLRKKKTFLRDECVSQSSWRSCNATQRPERCDANIATHNHECDRLYCSRCAPTGGAERDLCDAEQLLERVSGTRDALHDSHRRWSRHAHSHPQPQSHSQSQSQSHADSHTHSQQEHS